MQHVYMQKGHTFRPADPDALNIKEELPVGTYSVGADPMGFFLVKVEDMTTPARLYGDTEKNAVRILDTFEDRPASTGVLLSGRSGSGKTMLAKRVSELARTKGIITLLVNQQFCGEDFNAFLQSIRQPAMVMFDEFEKVYDRDHQPHLLTTFDGTYSSKKLFVLTANDKFKVDTFMMNRPGRIYYALEFGGLDAEFIKEYCADNLKNQDAVNGVIGVSVFFAEFSFDMLKALVEEMNRYGETATEAMKVLNMKPGSDDTGGVRYDCELWNAEGKKFYGSNQSDDSMTRNPLSLPQGWGLNVYAFDKEDEDDMERLKKNPCPEGQIVVMGEAICARMADLNHAKPADGVFVFNTNDPNVKMVFRRQKRMSHQYSYDFYD